MLITQANLQSMVDIGFVLLVTYTCIKLLIFSDEGQEQKREQWKSELKELEVTLRSLIEEASLESSTLNRELLKRKQELQVLLQKIEQVPEKIQSQTIPIEEDPEDSLPNETWVKKTTDKSKNILALAQGIEKIKQNKKNEDRSEPISYKVARRLLASGKEIHVVARKLDLPLAEIRQIEKESRVEQNNEEISRAEFDSVEFLADEFEVTDRVSLSEKGKNSALLIQREQRVI